MMSLVAIPLLVMMPEVLALWLKEVPEGTVLFSRLLIAACMIEQLTRGLVYANQAVGNIKWFSITISSIRILALPISWIMFHFGAPAYVAIVVFLICESIGSFSRIYILSKISSFKSSSFIKSVILQLLPPFIITFTACVLMDFWTIGILGILLVCLVSVICFTAFMYLFGLTSEEKNVVNNIVTSLVEKIGYAK
jgi:hypothetical protein